MSVGWQSCDEAYMCKAHVVRTGNCERVSERPVMPVGYRVPQSISNYFLQTQVQLCPVFIVRKKPRCTNGNGGNVNGSYFRY